MWINFVWKYHYWRWFISLTLSLLLLVSTITLFDASSSSAIIRVDPFTFSFTNFPPPEQNCRTASQACTASSPSRRRLLVGTHCWESLPPLYISQTPPFSTYFGPPVCTDGTMRSSADKPVVFGKLGTTTITTTRLWLGVLYKSKCTVIGVRQSVTRNRPLTFGLLQSCITRLDSVSAASTSDHSLGVSAISAVFYKAHICVKRRV